MKLWMSCNHLPVVVASAIIRKADVARPRLLGIVCSAFADEHWLVPDRRSLRRLADGEKAVAADSAEASKQSRIDTISATVYRIVEAALCVM